MTGYVVRAATPADVRGVRDLARRVSRELRLSRSQGDRWQATAEDLLWVIEEGRGHIVGSCAVRDEGEGTWRLHSLFLAPQYRGLSLGRAMVEHAVAVARRRGGLRVIFTSPAELREAGKWLARLGFLPDDEEAGSDRGPTFNLVLARPS